MGRPKNSQVVSTEWRTVLQKGKYSTSDIAKSLGVDLSSIFNWISGKYIPNSTNLRKLCKLYGIKVQDGTKMFERDHEKYLHRNDAKVASIVETPLPEPMNVADVPTESTENSHVHKIVFRAGESHKVVVRPTNALKQLFGTLVDANVDIASICNVLSAYDQFNGDLIEMLNFIYLKVTAEDYRKICKAVDPMLK